MRGTIRLQGLGLVLERPSVCLSLQMERVDGDERCRTRFGVGFSTASAFWESFVRKKRHARRESINGRDFSNLAKYSRFEPCTGAQREGRRGLDAAVRGIYCHLGETDSYKMI